MKRFTPSKSDFRTAAEARKPECKARRAAIGGRSAVLESPVFQARRRLWLRKHGGKV